MRKPAAYLFAILVGAIIWFFFQHFKVEGTNLLRVVPKSEQELNRIADAEVNGTTGEVSPAVGQEQSKPKSGGGLSDWFSLGQKKTSPTTTETISVSPVNLQTSPKQPKRDPNKIRIASFHLNYFGSSADDPSVIDIVASVVQHFDIVALQGVSPQGSAAITQLANKAGNYDAILPKNFGTQQQDQQFAYLFNPQTIIADKGDGLYTLIDPDNLLSRDPLIGWFRARAANAEDAFTFSLVNVHTSKSRAQQELDVLDDAMGVIRHDHRNEDDVIMVGCFQAPHNQLHGLGGLRGFVPTLRKPTTDLNRTMQLHNIVFQQPETDEWTGRSGVFDYFRLNDLQTNEAVLISDYLPVWAEFSIYEGGKQGRIATRSRSAY